MQAGDAAAVFRSDAVPPALTAVKEWHFCAIRVVPRSIPSLIVQGCFYIFKEKTYDEVYGVE